MEKAERERQGEQRWGSRNGWWITLIVGIIFSGITVWFVLDESEDRMHARIAQNWALVEEKQGATGNEGQIAALEALHNDDANLWHLALEGIFLRGAQLAGADLTAATLIYADLRDADLTRATLKDANLTCADFDRADFHGAVLTGANLTAADLRFALNLTQDQLNDACAAPYDLKEFQSYRGCESTDTAGSLPEGLKPPPPTC